MGGEDGGEVEKKERRKFAVLLCADDSEYVKKTYGGYFKVFVGLLGEEGEAWDLYRAAHGELPCMADVDGYDGFVITGSCNDAHGDDQWIKCWAGSPNWVQPIVGLGSPQPIPPL